MTSKEIARDVIGILVVLGAIVSLFLDVTVAGAEILRFLSGAVVGYYFGIQLTPLRIGIKAKQE